MTDKEKIRNEVEKCYSKALERAKITDADYWGGKADAYGNVLIQLDSLREEPVSEVLENAALEYATYYDKNWSEVKDGYIAENEKEAFKAGAKWQAEQCQRTIELAEDHAMLAGMEKMKEEMMAKAIRGRVRVNVKSNYHSLIYGCWDMDDVLKNCNEGDKVKVIVIKED